MTLNDKQFKDKLKKNDAKAVFFFEGHKYLEESNKHIRPFERLSFETNKELMIAVEEFSKLYPSKYTAYVGSTEKAIRVNGDVMKIDLSQKEIIGDKVHNAVVMNEAQIIEKITEQLQKEQAARVVERELKIANNTIEAQRLTSEKIAMVFNEFLTIIMNKFNVSAVMQGSKEAEETTGNIKTAVAFLRKNLGDQNIIKLVGKIQENPALIVTIKSFL